MLDESDLQDMRVWGRQYGLYKDGSALYNAASNMIIAATGTEKRMLRHAFQQGLVYANPDVSVVTQGLVDLKRLQYRMED